MKKQAGKARFGNVGSRRQVAALAFCFLGAVLVCAYAGCARRASDPFEPRRPALLERLSFKKQGFDEEEEVKEREIVQAPPELVAKLDGHVEGLRLDSHARRILVERRLDVAETFLDSSSTYSELKDLAEAPSSGYGVELWNVEFSDARLESFTPQKIGLLASTSSCAAFDEKGDRLFWTERELIPPAFSADARPLDSQIVRGAEVTVISKPQSAPNFNSAAIGNPLSAPTVDSRYSSLTLPPNSVLTKPLDKSSFPNEGDGSEIQHMRTSDETKSASCVWLSPQARWIVCYNPGASESDGGDGTATSDWALTLLRDKKRVVRFPAKVKMTFDNATSNETIEGKIIDVLDVSDQGDLAATLVEEQFPEIASENADFFVGKAGENGAPIETPNFGTLSPRYKIVIWDLNVARTVDLQKAKKPLMAIEVTQIAINAPVSRRFCKFSPSGDRIAARLEPKYITIWQSANGIRRQELEEQPDVVHDFAFAPHSSKLAVAVGGKHAQLILWEVRRGEKLRELEEIDPSVASIDAVAFTQDERHVYFANNFGEIKRWDILAGKRNK